MRGAGSFNTQARGSLRGAGSFIYAGEFAGGYLLEGISLRAGAGEFSFAQEFNMCEVLSYAWTAGDSFMRRGNRGVRGLDGELNSARGMYMRMYFIFCRAPLKRWLSLLREACDGLVYCEKRAMA